MRLHTHILPQHGTLPPPKDLIELADMVQVHTNGVNGVNGVNDVDGARGRLAGKNAIITGAAG